MNPYFKIALFFITLTVLVSLNCGILFPIIISSTLPLWIIVMGVGVMVLGIPSVLWCFWNVLKLTAEIKKLNESKM